MDNPKGEVSIICDLEDTDSREYADPFICGVERGKTVKFTAGVKQVSLLIPEARTFFNTDDYYWEKTLNPGDPTVETPEVRSKLKLGDVHEYYIFCHEIDKFAWKPYCSPPKMKIEG